MLDEKLDEIEKSILRTFTPHAEYTLTPSKLDLSLFRIAKWGLIVSVSTLYLLAHRWNPVWGALMTFLFAYSFSGVAGAIMEYLVYLLADPILLRGGEDSRVPKKPAKAAVIHFFDGTDEPAVKRMMEAMRTEIEGNRELLGSYKFILADESRDPEIRACLRNRLVDLQHEYGPEAVYYFHRSAESDNSGKSGMCRDLTLLLSEGWSRGKNWDEILGDVRSLGLRGTREELMAGRDVPVSEERIEYVSFCDEERYWPPGDLHKVIAKFQEPANAAMAMLQPRIRISNSEETLYARIAADSHFVNEFSTIAEWRLYRSAPFLAGGMMRLKACEQKAIETARPEAGRAEVPRPIEFSGLKTAFLEDVFILARVPVSKLAALAEKRRALYQHLLVLKQCFLKRQTPDQREYLWTVLRELAGPSIFSFWLAGTILTWLFHGIANAALLGVLFVSIAGVYLGLTGFLAPYFNRISLTRRPASLRQGITGAILSVLLDSMDVVINPQLLVEVLAGSRRMNGWRSFRRAEINGEVAGLSLPAVYKKFRVGVITGAAALVLALIGAIPPGLTLFLAPYLTALLAGPAVAWFSARPGKSI